MGVIVTFNYQSWIQLFPQFAYITQPQAQMFFQLATQLHRNDGGGPVSDVNTQTNLLDLATAHLVQLFAPNITGQSPNRDANVVGRITNASEGSVSVATEFPMPANATASWWAQTSYGAFYWTVSAPFRTMRYAAAPPKPNNPWPLSGIGPGGWWGNW
jgi:hypothetical protein